jgi:hypothetical protein
MSYGGLHACQTQAVVLRTTEDRNGEAWERVLRLAFHGSPHSKAGGWR